MFRRSSRDGQLLRPTAGAVFMMLRLAMAAAAGHAISPLMLSAGVPGYSSYCKRVHIRAGQGWLASTGPR